MKFKTLPYWLLVSAIGVLTSFNTMAEDYLPQKVLYHINYDDP